MGHRTLYNTRAGAHAPRTQIRVVYNRKEWWYDGDMEQISTSTAILTRLFARFEGAGELMASVPGGMVDLADRLAIRDGYFEGVAFKKIGREYRNIFAIRPDARPFVHSLLYIGTGALAADRWALGEMMNRIVLSGLETRPLSGLEMEYLQQGIGVGTWCSGIGVISDEGFGL